MDRVRLIQLMLLWAIVTDLYYFGLEKADFELYFNILVGIIFLESFRIK
jgi:hypothetical protein